MTPKFKNQTQNDFALFRECICLMSNPFESILLEHFTFPCIHLALSKSTSKRERFYVMFSISIKQGLCVFTEHSETHACHVNWLLLKDRTLLGDSIPNIQNQQRTTGLNFGVAWCHFVRAICLQLVSRKTLGSSIHTNTQYSSELCFHSSQQESPKLYRKQGKKASMLVQLGSHNANTWLAITWPHGSFVETASYWQNNMQTIKYDETFGMFQSNLWPQTENITDYAVKLASL